MIPEQPFRHSARCTLLGIFLACVVGNSASARGWEVSFDQDQLVLATLRSLAPDNTIKPCPEQFRSVHLVSKVDLDQTGSFAAHTNSPDLFHSTVSAVESVNKSMSFELSIDVKGCAFRHHFFPRIGHATISGDLGIAQLAHFSYELAKPEHGVFGGGDYKAGYTAYIAGPPQLSGTLKEGKFVPHELPKDISGDQVMGALWIELPKHQLKLISQKRFSETMWFERSQVKILILPEDTQK